MWKLNKALWITPLQRRAARLYLMNSFLIFSLLILNGVGLHGQSDFVVKIDSLIDRTEYNNAIQFIELSIDQNTAEDSLLAIYFHKMGLCYYQLYDSHSALKFFEKSLSIRKKILHATHRDIIRLHRNISVVQNEIGNIKMASSALEKALVLVRNSNEVDTSLMIDLYMQQGRLLTKNREFDRAREYLLQGKLLCEARPNVKKAYYIEVLELLANTSLAARDTFQIIHWSNKAIQYIESHMDDQEQNQFYLANAYHNLGTGYALLDSNHISSSHFEKSLIINQYGGNDRSYYVSYDFSNLALNYKNERQYTKALSFIDKAIGINIKNEDFFELMSNYENKATILLSANELWNGRKFIDKALQLLESVTYLKDDKNKSIDVLLTKAIIEQTIWKLDQSNKAEILKITDQLIYFLTDIRQGFLTDESKLILQEKGKEIYDVLIESLVLVYEFEHDKAYLERAFILADDAKSLVLFETVMHNNVLELPGIPEALITEELYLRRAISELEFQNDQQSPDPDLQTQLLKAREAYQRHKSKSIIENQHYKILSQTVGSSLIDDRFELFNKPIFEFYLSKNGSYLFFKDGLVSDVFRLPSQEKIYENATAVRTFITSNVSNSKLSEVQILENNKLFTENVFELYTLLFGPYLETNNELPKHFVVVPDGVLHYVPFDVLLSKTVDENYGLISEFPFLINEHTIQNIFSAKLNRHLSQSEVIEKKYDILSFAPSFENTQKRNNSQLSIQPNLSELLYNQDEVIGIADLISSKLYSQRSATKKHFMENANKDKIIHLATHAWANQTNSKQSYIAFSPDENGAQEGEKKMNLMFLHEIQNLNLKAALVTLSACDTGSGEYRKGEGVVSLGRAFVYAGAKSILMTLWQVDDRATSDISIEFYKQLKFGKTKDEALRMAKLNFLEKNINKSHPYYWSPFIVKGDMRTLALKEPNIGFQYYLLFMVGLLILICLTVVRKQKT